MNMRTDVANAALVAAHIWMEAGYGNAGAMKLGGNGSRLWRNSTQPFRQLIHLQTSVKHICCAILCDLVRSCAILCDQPKKGSKESMIGGGAIRARPPGFVGADLSCVRPAQHRCGRAIRAPSRFYDKLGIILSFGACWSPGGHKKGPPLRNSMRLVYPIAFCGIVLIESPECLAFDAVGRARGKCRIANDRSSNVVQMLPKRARRLTNG